MFSFHRSSVFGEFPFPVRVSHTAPGMIVLVVWGDWFNSLNVPWGFHSEPLLIMFALCFSCSLSFWNQGHFPKGTAWWSRICLFSTVFIIHSSFFFFSQWNASLRVTETCRYAALESWIYCYVRDDKHLSTLMALLHLAGLVWTYEIFFFGSVRCDCS